jgi:nitroreductase/dihydropteridine reductase
MDTLIKQLHWRYAVKQYDNNQKVADDQLELLKNVISLAPSSFGLQPFRVVLVEDTKTREKLRQASFNQSQITDASCLIVFAIENVIDEEFVDLYFKRLCQIRNQPPEGDIIKHRDAVVNFINHKTTEEKKAWATHQAYIALGFLLVAAAELGIDANPMEGFMASMYDDILGLRDIGLNAVVIAAIGHRHPDDFFQRLAKVRKPAEELFIQR